MQIQTKGNPKINVSYEGELAGGGTMDALGTLIGLATVLPIIFDTTLWQAIKLWWALVW